MEWEQSKKKSYNKPVKYSTGLFIDDSINMPMAYNTVNIRHILNFNCLLSGSGTYLYSFKA